MCSNHRFYCHLLLFFFFLLCNSRRSLHQSFSSSLTTTQMVIYEAARALVNLPNVSAREQAQAVSGESLFSWCYFLLLLLLFLCFVFLFCCNCCDRTLTQTNAHMYKHTVLQLFLSSPKATLRFAAVRTLNKASFFFLFFSVFMHDNVFFFFVRMLCMFLFFFAFFFFFHLCAHTFFHLQFHEPTHAYYSIKLKTHNAAFRYRYRTLFSPLLHGSIGCEDYI